QVLKDKFAGKLLDIKISFKAIDFGQSVEHPEFTAEYNYLTKTLVRDLLADAINVEVLALRDFQNSNDRLHAVEFELEHNKQLASLDLSGMQMMGNTHPFNLASFSRIPLLNEMILEGVQAQPEYFHQF